MSRTELLSLPLPARIRRIDFQLAANRVALAARNEKLLTLRGDFDALTLDFWRGFARGLGCEDPESTIAAQKERMRSVGHISIILMVVVMTVMAAHWRTDNPRTGRGYWRGRGDHARCHRHRTLQADRSRSRSLHHSRTRRGTFLADGRSNRALQSRDHTAG